MEQTYYTVDQISEMLSMHPKTIQRYIREGKLHAAKLGKAWRITGHDLTRFVERNGIALPADETPAQPIAATVSSVIDIDVPNMDEGMHIANGITAALNAKPPEYGKTSLNIQFIAPENKVRIMAWGNALFMEALMATVQTYIR